MSFFFFVTIDYSINGWWRLYHFIATGLSGIIVLWADKRSFQEHFRWWFLVYTCTMLLAHQMQYRYQAGTLYRLQVHSANTVLSAPQGKNNIINNSWISVKQASWIGSLVDATNTRLPVSIGVRGSSQSNGSIGWRDSSFVGNSDATGLCSTNAVPLRCIREL